MQVAEAVPLDSYNRINADDSQNKPRILWITLGIATALAVLTVLVVVIILVLKSHLKTSNNPLGNS